MIQDRILKVEKVAWQDIQPLQPTNIKRVYNYAWIERTVNKYGYANAFVVWQDPDTGIIYNVDGHIRHDVFGTIQDMPEKLTCVFIECKDKQEAIQILLEVYNQKSNPIDQEVLLEWLEVEEIAVEEIAVRTLNVVEEATEEETESEGSEQPAANVIKLNYTDEDHQQVIDGLSRIAQTPEQAVWELLGLG